MIDMMFAAVLAASASTTVAACPDEGEMGSDHLFDVCHTAAQDAPAYSATFSASLSPQPSHQQVTLFKAGGQWTVRAAGYKWNPGSAFETRRHEFAISDEDAQALIDRLDDATRERLSQLTYYGAPLVICSDGARTEIAMTSGRQRQSFAQHSCAGKSELHEVAEAFRSVALKYDPQFEGMLGGLTA